jgi:hypothetical protein
MREIFAQRQIESTMYGYDRSKHPDHAWVYPNGEIVPTSFTQHNQVAVEIIKNNGWEDEYRKSNKNRGYDSKEFLIIVKDFISINSGHFNFCGGATAAQRRSLGVDPAAAQAKMDSFFSDMC